MSGEQTFDIETALSKMLSSKDKSVVDIALALLDKDNIVMTTEIKDVGVANALLLAKHYADNTQGQDCLSAFLQQLYDARNLHMIPAGRKRVTEIKEMFASVLTTIGILKKQETSIIRGGSR